MKSKTRNLLYVVTIFIGSLMTFSCKKDFTNKDEGSTANPFGVKSPGKGNQAHRDYRQGTLILGKQLLNPYTINNMNAAYQSVKDKGIDSQNPVNIRVTHYYVKFAPKDWDQYNALVDDTSLSLYDYPLDYDIAVDGNRYKDPTITDSLPTFQYASVPVGFQFNNEIPYEILASLYIPEEDVDLMGTDFENEDFVDALLDQAYIQTDNYSDTIKVQARKPKWEPKGNIQIFDTRLNRNIPLQGVEVRARRWFTTHRGITDANGNYAVGPNFRREVNYSLWFFNGKFDVREHFFGNVCWINGPKQIGDWNRVISDGYDRFVGHVYRGAYRYHFGNIGGLPRPNFDARRIIYAAKDADRNWQGINFIVAPLIKIARWEGDGDGGNGREYGSDEIFSTTCHETGHSSHYTQVGFSHYVDNTNFMRESLAIGIEWFITHLEYSERGILNYGEWNYFAGAGEPFLGLPNDQGYQYWSQGIDIDNTSLFIDLIDNHNQFGRVYFGHGTGTVNDNVQGYSLPFLLIHCMPNATSLQELESELKANKPTGVTDAQIDQLLASYY